MRTKSASLPRNWTNSQFLKLSTKRRERLAQYLEIYNSLSILPEASLTSVQRALGTLPECDANLVVEYYKKKGDVTALNCYRPRLKISAVDKYPHVNLSKKSDLTARPPSGKYYLHHIAFLLSSDGREWLPRMQRSNNTFNISHLCHNTWCFNPSHLAIETRTDNLCRSQCQRHKAALINTKYERFLLHPCPHVHDTGLTCVLPKAEITIKRDELIYYYNK